MLPHFANHYQSLCAAASTKGISGAYAICTTKNELTGAINRVMAGVNYWFTLEVLPQDIDVLHLPDVSWKSGRTVFAQPSLR